MSNEPSRGRGRPSLYDPAFCETAIEAGRNGKSRAWIAAEFDVCKQTLVNWEAEHPDFLAAMDRAAVLSQRWWEDAGQESLKLPGFNSSVWSRSMAARFPDDWREKTEVKAEVKQTISAVPLSAEEWARHHSGDAR